MSLEETKTLLGVDNNRVDIIYRRYSARLLTRLKRTLPNLLDVPEELEYVLTECTIARYNRIGSEGMTTESMDGHSATYVDTDLSDYEHEIKLYLKDFDDTPKSGRVRFL